jgi:hypothetical protein
MLLFESLVLYCNMGFNYQQESVLPVLTGSQLRAARGLLNLSVSELAEQTGLAVNTIRRAEGTNGPAPITAANLSLLRTALETAGVLFISPDEQGPGVRLKSPTVAPMTSRRRDSSRGRTDL